MTIVYLAGNRLTGVSGDTKPTNVPANSIFVETDTKSQYLFDGSSTWNSLGSSGGTNTIFGRGVDGDVTIASNTTLTEDKFYDNLTVNSGVTLDSSASALVIHCKTKCTVNGTISMNAKGTASSDATNIISTIAGNPRFQNDCSSTTGWSFGDSSNNNVTGGVLAYNIKRDGSDDVATLDFGANVSNEKFLLRFKRTITAQSHSSGSNIIAFVGLSNNTNGAADNQDFIGFNFASNDNDGCTYKENAALTAGAISGTDDEKLSSGTKYYEIKRTSATSVTLTIYDDDAYSTIHHTQTESSLPSGVDSLRYFKLANFESGSGSGSVTGSFDDIKLWDGTTTPNGVAGSGGNGANGNGGNSQPWGNNSGQGGQPGSAGNAGGGNASSASQAT